MRLPAHCTALGKCLLAQLPAEVARAALDEEPYERRTERTLTTWTELAADLAAIRECGRGDLRGGIRGRAGLVGRAGAVARRARTRGDQCLAAGRTGDCPRSAQRVDAVACSRQRGRSIARWALRRHAVDDRALDVDPHELADAADEFASSLTDLLAARAAAALPGHAVRRRLEAGVRERWALRGWIGIHWPPELGGRGLSSLHTLACEERFGYRWLPLSGYLLSVKTIGNALLRFAGAELQQRLVPEVAAGRLLFCQGFSEPDAGSDLASLRTRARRDGDRFIVSGRKIWTSSAEYADWVYLAVRTDPDRDRHRGLSVLVADISTPGITVHTSPHARRGHARRARARPTSRSPPRSLSAICTAAGRS